jgi:hypothetical protein
MDVHHLGDGGNRSRMRFVDVQSLPDGLSGGPWLITRVTHRLAPNRGGETLLEGESADTESLLGALIGAALGTIGGLL